MNTHQKHMRINKMMNTFEQAMNINENQWEINEISFKTMKINEHQGTSQNISEKIKQLRKH